MLERKSPLSQQRIFGKFGQIDEKPGMTISEVKEFSYLELSYWEEAESQLSSKFHELLGLKKLPVAGASATVMEGLVLRAAPRRLVYYGGAGPQDILMAMISPAEGSTISLSHSRCALRLSGMRVRDVLVRGIRINLSDQAFSIGANAFTEIHGMSVLLIRRKEAEYDLLFMRSTAHSLWTWLTESAAQFGYEVMGR